MNCIVACGSIGPAGTKCNYICKTCRTKCHGRYAKSLSESLGKNSFVCKCDEQILFNNQDNTVYVAHNVNDVASVPSATKRIRI